MITTLVAVHNVGGGSFVLRTNAAQLFGDPPVTVTVVKANGIDKHGSIINPNGICIATAATVTGDTLSSLTFNPQHGDKAFAVGDIVFAGSVTTTVKDVLTPTSSTNTSGLYKDTDASTVTFDLSVKDKHLVVMAGNRTLAVKNDTVGHWYDLLLQQDATGSRTVTWWSGIKWAGGTAPTLTTTANKMDVIQFMKTAVGAYIAGVKLANV